MTIMMMEYLIPTTVATARAESIFFRLGSAIFCKGINWRLIDAALSFQT